MELLDELAANKTDLIGDAWKILFKVFASDEPIRPVYTRRAWQTAAINIPYTVVILIVIRWTIYSL
ncbi:MAG: hypothetical protein ACOVOJ_08145 [Pirellula sp.]